MRATPPASSHGEPRHQRVRELLSRQGVRWLATESLDCEAMARTSQAAEAPTDSESDPGLARWERDNEGARGRQEPRVASLPPILTGLAQGRAARAVPVDSSLSGLPLGDKRIDAMLPQKGLPYGTVTELQCPSFGCVGTSFALKACRALQNPAASGSANSTDEVGVQGGPIGLLEANSAGAANRERPVPWCAYLDPTQSLFAPGVVQHGVSLQHLLVVCPPHEEATARTAVHLAQSGLFPLIVIDRRNHLVGQVPLEPEGRTCRLNEDRQRGASGRLWERTVRRLSLAIEGKDICVLLLTHASPTDELLPVGLRVEATMREPNRLALKVTKERTGQLREAVVIPWVSPWSRAVGVDSAPSCR